MKSAYQNRSKRMKILQYFNKPFRKFIKLQTYEKYNCDLNDKVNSFDKV